MTKRTTKRLARSTSKKRDQELLQGTGPTKDPSNLPATQRDVHLGCQKSSGVRKSKSGSKVSKTMADRLKSATKGGPADASAGPAERAAGSLNRLHKLKQPEAATDTTQDARRKSKTTTGCEKTQNNTRASNDKSAARSGQRRTAGGASGGTEQAATRKRSKRKVGKNGITATYRATATNGDLILGYPPVPLLDVHNGQPLRNSSSWLTPHPHTLAENSQREYTAKPSETVVTAPPMKSRLRPRRSRVDHMNFHAVLTIYDSARDKNADYVLDVMPDPKSQAQQRKLQATGLLRCMWEKAETVDEGLRDFDWLPGGPTVVSLMPRHVVADHVQRQTECKVLRILVGWFEREYFKDPMDQRKAAQAAGISAGKMCRTYIRRYNKEVPRGDRLCHEALLAVAATAACRLLLVVCGKLPDPALRQLRPDYDFAGACDRALQKLHGTPEQRNRAAYMAGFCAHDARSYQPTAAEQAAVKTPPLPFDGCSERMFEHMTVHSAEPDVPPYPPALNTEAAPSRPDCSPSAEDVDCPMSDTGDVPSGTVATGHWPGLPPMSALIQRVGDCKFGLGPQDWDRWKTSIPRNKLLCSMSLLQHHEVQTLGWQALVKAGKPLPECAKWNGTVREGESSKRRVRHRSRKAVLAASSVTAHLANLPVARPALVRPREYLGCFNDKLSKLCPGAAKTQRREVMLPPKCTDPKFVWPAMMRPILTEVLLITCGDKFRRPRLLSAASQALLKYCADEERQMRDFLASGGCKGLHTPHVCTLDPTRISLPRFFTLINIARRNWQTTGLLNIAMPHLGHLTRPEQRFLKRAFPLNAIEAALFEAARTSGLMDPRLERLRERARAAITVLDGAPATPGAASPPESDPATAAAPAAAVVPAVGEVEAHGAAAGAEDEWLEAEYDALTVRMHEYMCSKLLYPWAFELDCGRHAQATHGAGIHNDTCIINAPVLEYLQRQLEDQKQAVLRTLGAELLAMQKLLTLIADESACLEIVPESSGPGGSRGQAGIDGMEPVLPEPTDTDVEMEDASAAAAGSNQGAPGGDLGQASQRIRCSRQESLEFAHGAIAVLLAGPLGIFFQSVVIGAVLDCVPHAAFIFKAQSPLGEKRLVLSGDMPNDSMLDCEEDEDDLVAQPHELQQLRALMQCGMAAFEAHCTTAVRGADLEPAADEATLCSRIAFLRLTSCKRALVPTVEEHLWPIIEVDRTLCKRFLADMPRRVSHGAPLYQGWLGIRMVEWRAVVVLRRPELYELEAIIPVPSNDWDAECMGPDRGGAAGLQHLGRLTLPRMRAFWGLDTFQPVRLRDGTVDERYVPYWWQPPPETYEYADRLPAGADVHDLDGMREVGALDMDVLGALRCTQQRRVAGGTFGRERRPAWVRKDLTGINGRAKIKDSRPPTRAEVLQKQHFAQELVAAAVEMFSRGGRLEFNREFWRFCTEERSVIYRTWIFHLRATGRNPPLSAALGPFPHGAAHHLRDAAQRLPGDEAIPRDIFNWLFDGFDDRTDGMVLPERKEHPGFAPAELVPYLPGRVEQAEAAGGADERLVTQAALAHRPEGFEDAMGLMQGLLELFDQHGQQLPSGMHEIADTPAEPVRHCALQPYTYPIMPLPSTAAARETRHQPCTSDYHESVLMRLSWPPAHGVALPLGWRGLCLSQVIALHRGFLSKRTCERVREAMEAGRGLQDVMAPGQKVELQPSENSIAAGVVPVSGLRNRQALVNGTRSQVREVLQAKGWSIKGTKIIGFPGQSPEIFLPGASRKGLPSHRKTGARGGAKGTGRQSKAAKGKPAAKPQPRRVPEPPRECLVHRAFDITGIPESAPVEDVWAAQKAAAVTAAAAAAEPPRGTASGPADAVLSAGSWLHRRSAIRVAVAGRRHRDALDAADEHLRGADGTSGPGANLPLWAEDMFLVLPFSSTARVTAAVEHRVGAGDVLRAAFASIVPFQGDGPTPFPRRSNPAAAQPPAEGAEPPEQWADRVLEERRALVRGADIDAARRDYTAQQLPLRIQAALEKELQAAGHAMGDGQKLVDAAPAAAVLTKRAARKSAMRDPHAAGQSSRASQPERHVRFRLPGEAAVPLGPAADGDADDLSASDAGPSRTEAVTQGVAAMAEGAAADAGGSPSQAVPSKRRKCDDGTAVAVTCSPASAPLDFPGPSAEPPAPPSPPSPPRDFGAFAWGFQADLAGESDADQPRDTSAVVAQDDGMQPELEYAELEQACASDGGSEDEAAGEPAHSGPAEGKDKYRGMTELERERAQRAEINNARMAELFGTDLLAQKPAVEKKAKPRKAIQERSENESMVAQRPRRAVPVPDYSDRKADADYRASVAEGKRAQSAAASVRRAARRAALAAGGAPPPAARRNAEETATVAHGVPETTVRHCVWYNTTPPTSRDAWVAAGKAADAHLESLGEDALACFVNLTVSMIDSGFWLQLPKELVHSVLDALGCDSFNPCSDTDASDLLHLFPEKGAGKTPMTITVREGRLEKKFWTKDRRASAALPADGAAESVLQFLPKASTKGAGVRGAGLSGGWRGVSIAHKLQRGDCAVFQVHLGGAVDMESRGSHAHLTSARAALQGASMSAWFFRARAHDDILDPYVEPDKPDADKDTGPTEGGDEEEEEDEEEEYDEMDLD